VIPNAGAVGRGKKERMGDTASKAG
jgi:hypothetical protein